MSAQKRKTGRIIAWSLGGPVGVIFLILILVYLLRIPVVRFAINRYNKKIPGELSMKPARVLPLRSLPIAEIYLHDIRLCSPPDSALPGDTILEVEEMMAAMDLRVLMKGDFSIPVLSLKKGRLACHEGPFPGSLLEEALGLSFSPDSSTVPGHKKEQKIIGLDSVFLEDMALCWSDPRRDLQADLVLKKLQGSFSSIADTVVANIEVVIDINDFKYQKYRLKNENNVSFSGAILMDLGGEILNIDSSFLHFSGLDIVAGGSVAFGEHPWVELGFEARNQGIEVLNYLLSGILDLDEIEQTGSGQLELKGKLKGPYGEQLPVLEVEGVADRLSFLIKPVEREVKDISFYFYSTNGKFRDLSEAQIRLEDFRATFPEGEVAGNFAFRNRITPQLDMELHGELELAGLEHMLSLDSISDLEGKVRLEGNVNGILDKDSGNFLNDAAEMSAFVQDMGFITGRHTLKNMNGEFYVQGKKVGARNMSLDFNGNNFQLKAEVEDIILYLMGYQKDITAHLGISSELIRPGSITHDTVITSIVGEELRGLAFGASAHIGHEELDALVRGDTLSQVNFELNSFGIELPGFADISQLNAAVTMKQDTVMLHFLDGIVGESAFRFEGEVSGYRSLIDGDSAGSGEIKLGFSITSPQMRAMDFFTMGSRFILPEQYENEYLENFSIAGDLSVPAESILNDSLPLDFRGKISELEWRFRFYPMTFEKFFIEARKEGDVLYLDEFRGRIGESDLRMQAEVQNVDDSLIENMSGYLAIESELLDLNELLNFQVEEKENDTITADTMSAKKAPGLSRISYPAFQFDLNIGELIFEDYVVRGINGILKSTKEKVFYADQFRINSESGGLLEFTGQFSVADPDNYNFSAQVDLTDVNLHDLDFEMQAGEEVYSLKENFAGTVSGTGMAEVFFTPELKFDIPRTTALFHVEVKEGELINFTPLQAAGKYLDNKNLDHVRFSTLRNSFTLMDSKVIVPLMIVESTLGQLLIEGEQGLDKSYLYLLYIPMDLVRDAAKSVLTAEEDETEDEIQKMQIQKVLVLTPWSDGVESGVRVGDKRDKYRE